MYYAAHLIYISKNNFLKLHVIKVEQGRVVSLFPFDGELQSMQWADRLLLSNDSTLGGCVSALEAVLPHSVSNEIPSFAYKVISTAGGFFLEPV